jgi:hypothetical protein
MGKRTDNRFFVPRAGLSSLDTTNLQQVMRRVEKLISMGGHADKAAWLATRREIIKNGFPDQIDKALNELARVIAGMGSLSDLSLAPSADSNLTAIEAQSLLLELLDELYEEIQHLKGRLSIQQNP